MNKKKRLFLLSLLTVLLVTGCTTMKSEKVQVPETVTPLFYISEDVKGDFFQEPSMTILDKTLLELGYTRSDYGKGRTYRNYLKKETGYVTIMVDRETNPQVPERPTEFEESNTGRLGANVFFTYFYNPVSRKYHGSILIGYTTIRSTADTKEELLELAAYLLKKER